MCNLCCCRCGSAFEVEVVAEAFQGKRLLERHRLVQGAVSHLMGEIHAFSIKKAAPPSQTTG